MSILLMLESLVMSAVVVVLLAGLMQQVKNVCHNFLSGNRV